MDALEQFRTMKFDNNALYCECVVCYKDEPETPFIVKIKLNCSYNEEEDDDIFFYCNSVYDLEGLCDKNNGEDFYIEDFCEIY